jgi:hypothetical protein
MCYYTVASNGGDSSARGQLSHNRPRVVCLQTLLACTASQMNPEFCLLRYNQHFNGTCCLLYADFLLGLVLRPKGRGRHVPSKYQLTFNILHSFIFIMATAGSSNPTQMNPVHTLTPYFFKIHLHFQ